VLFAEFIDFLERYATPIGVVIGLLIIFGTRAGRKSIEDGRKAGERWRKKLTGEPPDDEDAT
jgi:hypothetical protein